MNINLCKSAYKTVRAADAEIFRGFGFRHLSDVTACYVHPRNESRNKTTTLCQPIGEALILLKELFRELAEKIRSGFRPDQDADLPFHFTITADSSLYALTFAVPAAYHAAHVVAPEFCGYSVSLVGQNIKVHGLNASGEFIPIEFPFVLLDENTTLTNEHAAWWLPAVMLLMLRDMVRDEALRTDFIRFALDPLVDQFVRLHEDFYQDHKLHYVNVECAAVHPLPEQPWRDGLGIFYPALFEETADEIKDVPAGFIGQPPFEPFPPDRFTAEAQEMIPRMPKEFLIPAHLIPLAKAVRGGDCLAILLQGPSGTGKSIACKLICEYVGLPLMAVISCTENLDEFVLGKYIPKNGRIEFMESDVTKAIRHGGAVVFEEINFGKPQYLAFLNSLLDDNGFVRLDSGELVRRHPDFYFFATMNAGYLGTRQLNAALFNRFQAVITLNELSESAIRRMLLARIPACEANLDNMLAVYHKIRLRIMQEELDAVISPRNLESWAKLALYQPFLGAAELAIVAVAREDEILAKAIRGMLKIYSWKDIVKT